MRRKRKSPAAKLMTERRIRRYLKQVHETGKSRNREFGEKFSAPDFAAGAGVMLAYLGRMDLLPAYWIFGMHIGGKNPFSE